MSYVNAENILPKHLVEEIQRYVDGQLLYIPRKSEKSLSWGEKSGAKVKLENRNKEILDSYYAGMSIEELCGKFYLSAKRIHGIIHEYERPQISIRAEKPQDYEEIRSLVQRSFLEGTGYTDGIGEVALIEEIRASEFYIPELSFVAEWNDKLVGHFMFSKFPLSKDKEGHWKEDQNLVILMPVAVHIDYLRQGIGSTMLRLGIQKVKEAGYRGIIVEGNPAFYNRVGFQTSLEYNIYATSGFPLEAPQCMMCQEAYEGTMNGIEGYVVYDMYKNV